MYRHKYELLNIASIYVILYLFHYKITKEGEKICWTWRSSCKLTINKSRSRCEYVLLDTYVHHTLLKYYIQHQTINIPCNQITWNHGYQVRCTSTYLYTCCTYTTF